KQVILDTSWKQAGLTEEQIIEMRVLLGRAYQELYAGYHLSRILTELVDEIDHWHVKGQRSLRGEFRSASASSPALATSPRTTPLQPTAATLLVRGQVSVS